MDLEQKKKYMMHAHKLTEERALSEMKDARENPPTRYSTCSRDVLKKWAKEYLLKAWQEKRLSISAKELTEWAVRTKDYHTKVTKGFGDVLGNGGNCLYLKPAIKKLNGAKAYLIPDPERYESWYENDDALPMEYYGSEYLLKLDKIQFAKGNDEYFAKRTALYEVANELE